MLNTKIGGFYKLEAINAKTGKSRLLADWFPNLITDIGLDYLGSVISSSSTIPDSLRCCYVGSSSVTPAVSDIGMGNLIATSDAEVTLNLALNKATGVNSTTPYYRYYRGTYRFGIGVAAGNISEVGMGWSTVHTGATFSRALVLDSYSNPTTITVLSDEYLDVTYEYRSYPNESDVTGSVTFTGNIGGTYDWTIRPGQIATLPYITGTSLYFPAKIGVLYGSGNATYYPSVSDADIGAITSNLLATYLASNVFAAYTAGTYYRDTTITVPLSNGNFATGIRKFTLWIYGCGYQIRFDPVIPKTASDIVTITLRVSWSRV